MMDMAWAVTMCVLALVALITARDAKWFLPRSTTTRYVYQQRMQTLVVPSSCVVVEPSLKPCRHLRYIEPTPPVPPQKILMTAAPRANDLPTPVLKGSQGEPSWTWPSLLGLGDVTVTETVTQLVTARMASPAAMVTFSVRGCQPSRLPFDLPLCTNSTHSPASTILVSSTKDVHFVPETGH